MKDGIHIDRHQEKNLLGNERKTDIGAQPHQKDRLSAEPQQAHIGRKHKEDQTLPVKTHLLKVPFLIM